MNFYISKILPFISLLTLIYQLFFDLYFHSTIEKMINIPILTVIKYISLVNYFLSIFSFIKTYMTEPGYVMHQTNKIFLEFYQKTRQISITRANKFNRKYNLKTNNSNKDNNKNDNALQCEHCNVMQIYRIITHCSICSKCIYMKDHHCMWLNQCIGQFNIKYYILFYLLVGSYISILECYYFVSKNYIKIIIEYSLIQKIYLFAFSIFSIIHIILSIKLLYDQYINLDYYSVLYDKSNEIIEIRNKYEIVCEYFGEKFGISWFFPIKAGGYYLLFQHIKILKKENNSKK